MAERRTRRGPAIEGEIARGARAPSPAVRGDAALKGLRLEDRHEQRPYQSLLDDAIRLAKACRIVRAGRLTGVPTR